MTQSLERDSAIRFPNIAEAGGSLVMHTFGFRINGFWVVKAQLPPRMSWAERPLLGRIMLDVRIGQGYENLEPNTVNRHAHIWVAGQAEAAGLQVVGYQNLNPRQPDPGSAFARYVVAHA